MDGVFGNGLPEDAAALPESRFVAVGARVCQSYLRDQRSAALSSWSNRSNWIFVFYFGIDDDRLWVPTRTTSARAHPTNRIINLGHPLARGAKRLLIFGYSIGLGMLCVLTAIATGSRW